MVFLEKSNTNAILKKYQYLIKKEHIGNYGKLNESDLLNSDDFINDIKLFDQYYNEYSDEDDIDITNTELYKIWYNYSNAMSRRRPASELEFERFIYYLNHPNTFLYKFKNSYIIGQFKNGYFKPSHFSPNTISEGVKTIQELSKYSNIVFAVTDDLKAMLTKMGLYSDNSLIFPMWFRDLLVIKHILVTDPDVLSNILFKLSNNEIDDLENMSYDDIVNSRSNSFDRYDKYSQYEESRKF